jgi:hypothetical protein
VGTVTVTIRQALQNVANYPNMIDDNLLTKPVHELVCRELFVIANQPDASVRGSMAKANKARKLILDRLVGKRRPGSHPATRTEVQIDFVDLTGGEIGEPSEGVQPAVGRGDPVEHADGESEPAPGSG